MPRFKLSLRRLKYLVLGVLLINIFFTFFLPSKRFFPNLSTYEPITYLTRNFISSYAPTVQSVEERWLEKCWNCSKERLEEVKGWEKDKNRNVEFYIKDETLKNGRIFGSETYLVIFVFSAPESFQKRDAIRKTWAVTNINARVLFILGTSNQTSIDKESSQFEDIIQENFYDSKKNMTIKSIMMLKWFIRNCPTARYLMKTDDDMVVFLPNLVNLLYSLRYPRVALFGMKVTNAAPFTDPKHEWYVPKYMYEKDIYPNFLSGKGYVMSKSVAVKLFMVSMRTPMVHLEDVYLTGICAEKAGISRLGHLAFSYKTALSCFPYNVITVRVPSPEFLIKMWPHRENCSYIVRDF